MDWKQLLLQEKLSTAFVEEHADKIDWDEIIKTETLSEEWIETYAAYINWKLVEVYQTLSIEFIEKHKDKLGEDAIARYELFKSFKESITYIDWNE